MKNLDALALFLKNNNNNRFEWGKWDCCLFAADCVKALTGEDYAAVFRNRYSSAIGAKRVLLNEGYSSLKTALIAVLGTEIPAKMAQRGDVVLIEQNGEFAAGIIWAGQVLCTGSNSLQRLSLSSVICAWRIS